VRAAGLIETRPAWAYEIEITDIREIIANSPKTPLRTFTEGSFTLPTTGSQAHPCFTGAAGAGPSYPAASVRPRALRLPRRGVFWSRPRGRTTPSLSRRQRQDNVAQASCGRRIELSLSTTRRSSHILMLPSGSRSGLKPTLPNGMVEAMASNAVDSDANHAGQTGTALDDRRKAQKKPRASECSEAGQKRRA
jgi:hypothetical protein